MQLGFFLLLRSSVVRPHKLCVCFGFVPRFVVSFLELGNRIAGIRGVSVYLEDCTSAASFLARCLFAFFRYHLRG